MPAWARQALDRIIQGKATPLDALHGRPELLMVRAGLPPDPWQTSVLRTQADRLLMLCSRQCGKSQVAAAVALHTALTLPGSLTLLLSPTLRQSGELFRDKVMRLYHAAGRPLPADRETALELHLGNGSRIVSLPGDEGSIRGFSGVALLVIDEAARVPDALYYSVRPMLAVSRGRLICLSSPYGRRGWFYDAWTGPNRWERVKVTAEECPRISREFLADERTNLGPRWYSQEYCCTFEATLDQAFPAEAIEAAFVERVEPLHFPEDEPR